MEWGGGRLLGQDDANVLLEAAKPQLTLVTYDLRTIPVLLKSWAEEGRSHAGAILIDERTIAVAKIGMLVRGLSKVYLQTNHWDWRDRISFLRR